MPAPPPTGQILPPVTRRGVRMLGRGSSLFDDENLDMLAHILDDWFQIPFTNIRFGLDGIVGLIPGLGDVLIGLSSLLLIVAAWVRGVPYVTLLNMGLNVGIAVVVGSVPLFGDAFDVWWKPNRRNYKLLTRHLESPRRTTWRDWVYLASLLIGLLMVLSAPIWLIVLLFVMYAHR